MSENKSSLFSKAAISLGGVGKTGRNRSQNVLAPSNDCKYQAITVHLKNVPLKNSFDQLTEKTFDSSQKTS